MSEIVFDNLFAHAGFVRAVARELLGETHDADDVVQETWRAALEHPPTRGGALKPWLATVVRNFVLKRRRGETRRGERERAVAREELVAGADAVAERHEALRRVVDAVLALPEPYRSTVVMRFYEDLPPREIARRERISVDTVQTRLRRAIERLRGALDGASSEWRAPLALIVGVRSPAVTAGLSTAATGVAVKVKLALVALTVALVAVVAYERAASSAPDGASGASAAVALNADVDAPRSESERRLASGGVAGDVAISGRVLDTDGRPAEGVRVFIGGDRDPFGEACAAGEMSVDGWYGRAFETDADGRYRAELDGPVRVVVTPARSPRFAGTAPDRWVDAPASDVDLIVRRFDVAVLHVRAEYASSRRPLENFRSAVHGVGAHPTVDWYQQLADGARTTFTVRIREPDGAHAQLELLSPKTSPPVVLDLLLTPNLEREFVLVVPSEGHTTGYVVDAQGAAVEGAYVGFGDEWSFRSDEPFDSFRPERIVGAARSAADGWFEVEGEGEFVTAWHAEHSPATVPLARAVRIALPPRASIHGLLLDADGAPLAGADLALDDQAPELWTETDAAGAFEFRGLEAGAHSIRFRGRNLAMLRLEPGERAPVELRDVDGVLELEFTSDGAPVEMFELDGILIGLERRFSSCQISHWRPRTEDPAELRTGFNSDGVEMLRVPSPREVTIRERVEPGRYLLISSQGLSAEFEVRGERAVVALGSAPVEVHCAARRAVQLVPADADAFTRRVAARCTVDVAAGASARFAVAPGRYVLVGRDARGLRTFDVPAAGATLEVP